MNFSIESFSIALTVLYQTITMVCLILNPTVYVGRTNSDSKSFKSSLNLMAEDYADLVRLGVVQIGIALFCWKSASHFQPK